MDKRYQVFVSSTFQDLQDERQEVIQALLELDCIPAGMELFPAANDDQWTLIKKVIDDCDYYLVIIAGRYGTVGPDGRSYTEMEYRYALEQGKPIIAFLHKQPELIALNRSESDPDRKKGLEAFRAFAQQKMCRFWDSPADLGSQVSRSLIKLIKSTPAVGWVRADLVPDKNATEEILALTRQVEQLDAALKAARTTAPEATKDLSQGEDEVTLGFTFRAGKSEYRWDSKEYSSQFVATWDDLFFEVSPLMIHEASDQELKEALARFVDDMNRADLLEDADKSKGPVLSDFQIADDDFQTIKVQFRALGLITKSTKPRSVKDTATYWTLTAYGDDVMTKLRAIRRPKASPTPLEPSAGAAA